MKSCKSRTTLYFDYSPDRNDSIMTSWHDADTRATVWPVKSRQTSIKLPKNESTRKMKDFDTYTKITLNGGNLGNKNCCQRLSKVAQSAINRPIWSHCTRVCSIAKSSKTGFVPKIIYLRCVFRCVFWSKNLSEVRLQIRFLPTKFIFSAKL